MSRLAASLKSSDYDEKINKLLEEGRKLGSIESGRNLLTDHKLPINDNFSEEVSKLKKEIEQQNEKTVQLQSEIKQATDKARSLPPFPRPQYSSLPSNLPSYVNMNSNNNNNRYLTSRPPGPYGDVNHSSMPSGAYRGAGPRSTEYIEQALEDSQAQVNYLTKKLEEVHETSEKQKVHFRTAVEDLQTKLQETVAGRKQLVQLRETEMADQEEMIQRLQTTLKELATANQMQEQSLLDAHERMQLLEKRNTTSDDALGKIRTLFNSHEKIKGKTFRLTEKERLNEISPEFLVGSIEQFLNDSYEEIEILRNKVVDLETEICDVKETHDREVDMLSDKQQEAAEQLKIEMNERVLAEKLNTDSAMKQVYSLQDEVQQQRFMMSSKEQEVRDIEKQLTITTTQFEELKNHYFEDKDSLQSKLLSTEAELTSTREGNETYKRELERIKQQISDSQENFLRTNEELKSEREQRRNLWIKETENGKEIHELKQKLEERTAEVAALKEKNSDLRADLPTQVMERVREVELVERSKADSKISLLTEDVTRLREELSSAKATLESTERQISDVMVERSNVIKTVQDKDQQLERISSQHNVAERKLAEVIEAKKNLEEKWEKIQNDFTELSLDTRKSQSENKKMKKDLDEKEKSLVTLRHQVDNLSSAAHKSSEEIEEVKVERSRLKIEVKEISREIEKLRSERSSNDKTISDYENRIGELIQAKTRLDAGVREIEEEKSNMRKEKEQLGRELKETRSQISILLDEKDQSRKEMNELQTKNKSENEKLKKQLRHMKQNLQQTENSLKTIKSVDGRAAEIAANMQQEVTDKRTVIDTLQTEMSKAYDKLDSLGRENKDLKSEVAMVTEKLSHTDMTQQKLSEELKQRTKSEKGYKLAVERMEKALEKAAMRNSTAQTTIGEQEQEIARMHIQHKMQIMDKRSGQIQTIDPSQPVINTLYQQPAPSTNVAQSLLTRMILNMTSQPTIHDITNPIISKAIPVFEGEEKKSTNSEMNADIYKVLSEVRDHLVKLDNTREMKRRSPERRRRQVQMMEDSDSSDLPVVTMTSDAASLYSLSLLESAAMISTLRDPLLTSSPYKPDTRRTTGGTLERPPSPVSELLGPSSGGKPPRRISQNDSPLKKSPKRILLDNTESNSIITSENTSDLMPANTSTLKTAITNTAEDLCRQLQSRIDGLSRMGGQLQKQNKMTEKMIQKQDEKLQKVRGGLKLR